MERARGAGRESVDFDAAQPAFFEIDLQIDFLLAGD
jgi:hypothetical protein